MQILGWLVVVVIVLFLVYVARKGNKEDVQSCCDRPSTNVVPVKKTPFVAAMPVKKARKVAVKKTK